MKRLHVNLTVTDLNESIDFYNHLFATEPAVSKPDYAKWMLDDPRINFSINTHGTKPGVDHLGLQTEDDAEFTELRARLNAANIPIKDQTDVTCCYAKSTKAWIRDPNGVAWETFVSHGASAVYGDGSEQTSARVAEDDALRSSACCSMRANDMKSCCT